MKAPKYEAGSVIDLRFTRNTMPDRIYINMVYRKANSTDWMYEVLSEKNGKVLYMSELQIDKNISKKESKCYEHELVKKMYKDGFRFCGNSKCDSARNRANGMVNANYIRHIVLCDAIDSGGEIMDGYLGLWVMYNITIDEDNPTGNSGYYHYVK